MTSPSLKDSAAVRAATKLPPMCNYPGEGFMHMTTNEWKRKKMSDIPKSITHKAKDKHGAHRTRATWDGKWTAVSVYLTDSKRIDPPTKQDPPSQAETTVKKTLETMAQEVKKRGPLTFLPAPRQSDQRIPSHEELHTMKRNAEAGVSIVAVPQLFRRPLPWLKGWFH